jgi:DNA-binding GntR family transcriptional regulator
MSTTRTEPLSARAYAAVKRLIIDGSLQPGDQLKVRPLSERLSLSATPVKAALSALARDGFVTSEPQRGFFVTVLSDRDVRELFQLREALEPYAARLAVTEGLEAADMDCLRRLTAQQHEAAAGGDRGTYNELNLRFHRTLWRMGGNTRLDQLMDDVVGQMSLATTFTSQAPGRIEHAISEHVAIVDLCEARRVDELGELVARHVRDSYAAYRQMVAWDPWPDPPAPPPRHHAYGDT